MGQGQERAGAGRGESRRFIGSDTIGYPAQATSCKHHGGGVPGVARAGAGVFSREFLTNESAVPEV
jgi:hypothetical protein